MAPAAPAPGADKARFVRTMFDAIAARYDLMNRLMTGGQDERWRALTADAVYPEATRLAIDVGAGTGDLALALAARAPGGHVLALDFSERMLRLGADKVRRKGRGARVQPLLGDAMQLPVADATVEAVVSGFTLRNVNDVDAVFRAAFRVLRPGGRLALLELTPVTAPIFGPLFRFYFHRIVPRLGALVSGTGYAYQYLPESVVRFPDADRLAKMLRAAGFADVRFRKLAMGTVALHTAEKPSLPVRLPEGAASYSGGTPSHGESHRATPTHSPTLPTPRGRGAGGEVTLRQVTNPAEWNALLAALPNAHGMQTWEWGELRRETGWTTRRLAFERDGAVVAAASVQRRGPAAPLPGVSYCPKGPALDYGDAPLFGAVLRLLADDARRQRSVFLSIEPEAEAGAPGVVSTIRAAGYLPSTNQLQANATFLVDVAATDNQLLGRMSSTWRRYVRKAPRDGVTVRRGTEADLDRFYELYRETSERDAFVARPRWYFSSLWRHLAPDGLLDLFLADVDGRAEAALIPLRFGRRAWYLYGASSDVAQKAHAPYLLQWHTMRWARDHGCDSYDMWGAAADPSDENDPLAGVTRQKRGYGGRHVRWVGGYDYVASPALYAAWQRAVPRAFAALRRLRGERGAPIHSRALGG